ncbi:sensor histidine kinase [Nocardioides lianchengensis]|uniref:histidine kinase n=1 Tax=Nocardioides lianchengensis TaxID=1045774 RepID=A0A1G7B7Q6_9ACTN|nr:HAMP domain-containing sensor histidine kinase [Nocardioides lianchengensis]NYG10078.1 two-component system sensor histidine kinase BaeS [Nocardioides lianchengensis]SDE23144.1 two-component system, OmpR family, sensor histidine kinase BaeS [Nocardioides lianchengensis]
MSGPRTRVPWRRSLFVRIFGIAAVVALVAVAAATWATVRATTVAVREEEQESLHTDARTYDALVDFAATHRDWAAAAPLVDRLARQAGHRVSVTDLRGRALVDSEDRTDPRDPARARATLDPLDVDTVLRDTLELPATAAVAEPAVIPCDEGDGEGCRRYAVAPPGALDSRALGPFADSDDTRAWTRLQALVDRCLGRAGLAPVEAVVEDFSVIVAYRERHGTVARCADRARRAALSGYVAPAALLFVADGSESTADVLWDFSRAAQLRIAWLAGAVLLVTLLLCAVLAGSVVRPLRRMAAVAQRAGDGDLGARVPARRPDEVGEVAQAFNRMAERRQQLEEARRRLVGDVSHELRTPLANVRGWLEAAQDGLVEPDDRLLASLHEETLHLQRLVDDLHDLALGDAGELRLEPAPVDLALFLAQVAEAFGGAAEAAGIELDVAAEPGSGVRADPVRLRQAVGNLVANALRHTPRGGRVTLAGSSGRIAVSDTGEGIPADELPHVFERFRRVDPSRSRATGGSGLGLAIVRQITEAHGGAVEVTSTVGRGTTVALTLPGEPGEPDSPSAPGR